MFNTFHRKKFGKKKKLKNRFEKQNKNRAEKKFGKKQFKILKRGLDDKL